MKKLLLSFALVLFTVALLAADGSEKKWWEFWKKTEIKNSTPSDTLSVKTYKNVDLGFSFVYPSDLSVHEEDKFVAGAVNNISYYRLHKKNIESGKAVSVVLEPEKSGTSLKRKTISFSISDSLSEERIAHIKAVNSNKAKKIKIGTTEYDMVVTGDCAMGNSCSEATNYMRFVGDRLLVIDVTLYRLGKIDFDKDVEMESVMKIIETFKYSPE